MQCVNYLPYSYSECSARTLYTNMYVHMEVGMREYIKKKKKQQQKVYSVVCSLT